MLSAYKQELLSRLDTEAGSTTKLVPNLFVKEKYVAHYRNLQPFSGDGIDQDSSGFIIQAEALVQKIHWFQYRNEKMAKNDCDKDFFKLMNKSDLGKTMENLRKRVDIQLFHYKRRLINSQLSQD